MYNPSQETAKYFKYEELTETLTPNVFDPSLPLEEKKYEYKNGAFYIG